jgi:hypothetical protein
LNVSFISVGFEIKVMSDPFAISEYQYTSPLTEPDSIRLLRLLPLGENNVEDAEIKCEIFNYSLRDKRKKTHLYEALSYTWGDSGKALNICLGNQTLAITENLHAALIHLRDRSIERILWIDAICINQDDPEESGRQVQFMAKIYNQAQRVIVWLGVESFDSTRALETVCEAANKSTEDYQTSDAGDSFETLSQASTRPSEASSASDDDYLPAYLSTAVRRSSDESSHNSAMEADIQAITNLLERR